MNYPVEVVIPLLNPNEPEALLAALNVSEGQEVAAGDVLCSLETTKSSADLTAEVDGYVAGLRLSHGQPARAGEILCYLADSPGWKPPAGKALESEAAVAAEELLAQLPAGLRITQPALALARQRGLDLSGLPIGPLITEAMVQARLGGPIGNLSRSDISASASPFNPAQIVVYGGGGHGKMVVDLLRVLHLYQIVGIIDDGLLDEKQVMGLPVLGGAEKLAELFENGIRLAVNAVGGIGDISVRIKIFRRLAEAGFVCPALIHPSATVETSASLDAGVQIFAKAYVGSEAQVGYGVIIGTGAIVSHDCRLGNYVNLSPGAILAGAVQVGSGALVGMGVTINLETKVGAGARIGNGATVKADIPENGIVRAGAIWPQ